MHVLITGATRGIGAALAAHYQSSGATVTCTARATAPGFEPLDVTDPASQAALAARLKDQPIDLLILIRAIRLTRAMMQHSGPAHLPPMSRVFF